MRSLLKVTLRIILFCFLTILTQVGGVIYLISIGTRKWTDGWASNKFFKAALRLTSFLIIYCLATFLIVPAIAKPFGRVVLPLTETNHLQPLNILTVILNRAYVTPDLRQATFETAISMNEKYPGTTLNYLDANFPFIEKFPLIPHLSHNDGKKLDLAFCYLDAATGAQTNKTPSVIGYGVCEEPLANEINTGEICSNKGYWQYSFLSKVIPQTDKKNYRFDSHRTRELVNIFTTNAAIGKIFIEPHLKTRLNLTSGKIRFHGCRAVRHDDHIHLQLR
jgi:hypothetical protein